MTTQTESPRGPIHVKFEPVRHLFAQMLSDDPNYSAGVCAYVAGEKVVDLVGGPHLQPTSLTPVFSATKGAAGLCIALLVERGQLDLDERVATYWPEFVQGGKGHVTVRQLLSHQAGLVGVDGGFSAAELNGHDDLARRLAAQTPVWYPGAAHGYHAVTIGTLADELVRRITGQTLSAFFESELRQPTGADFYIGLPEAEVERVQPVRPLPAPTPDQMAAAQAIMSLLGPWSPFQQAFGGGHPEFPQDLRDLGNDPAVWRAGPPAVGGLASAAGLATVYASAIMGLNGPPLLSPQTVALVSQLQTTGPDRVLPVNSAFAVMFMKPTPVIPFGSYRAFGHDGAGGALGFADPTVDLAFGYVPASMTWPGGADPRALALSNAIRVCLMA